MRIFFDWGSSLKRLIFYSSPNLLIHHQIFNGGSPKLWLKFSFKNHQIQLKNHQPFYWFYYQIQWYFHLNVIQNNQKSFIKSPKVIQEADNIVFEEPAKFLFFFNFAILYRRCRINMFFKVDQKTWITFLLSVQVRNGVI